MEVSVSAAAKINLFLEILDKRQDSYHNIETVMQSVSLYDTITIVNSANFNANLTLNGDINAKIKPKNNTVYKAANAFFDYTGIKTTGLEITIKKNIPLCAGLAGGSADAAATLLALDRIFKTTLKIDQLKKIGEKIGADVPFCISGGTSLAQGIGTKLTTLPHLPKCFFVIVKPEFNISTKNAYELFDNTHKLDKKNATQIIKAVKNQDIKTVSNLLFNRFEKSVSTKIAALKSKLTKCGALGSCMTGSGSTVFGVFDNENLALKCQELLHKRHKASFLCEPTKAALTFL
ncbi:MAG: 4-(cytidine 5'-diphospho)-2-C-methyl-D-erythritol kinase [Oscillospiraceae bacterium]|jgi:4-diphosphocytidyl-2-C-methyl-D-erythritol kinase|nr:4-(cytidine 5'-diphospho)-2-C-methyl-D-erythritol kinase [Oscillospiraceae bacterium]